MRDVLDDLEAGWLAGETVGLGTVAKTVRDDVAPVLQRYGVSDDDAFSVGLTCGGIIDIFVEPVSQETFPELGAIAEDIRAGRPVAVATLISGAEDRVGAR